MNVLNKEIPLFSYFRTRFWLIVFNSTPNHGAFDKIRNRLLRLIGLEVRGNAKVFSPLLISPKTKPKNIILNGFVFLNSGTRFSAPGNSIIEINNNVLVGPNVSFETVNHGLVYKIDLPRGAIVKNIKIEEGVWIGINSTILQGVTIGKGSVVAASSVVTKQVDPYTLVGGIPASPIRKIDV